MRNAIGITLRGFLLFYLLVATAWSFDALLVLNPMGPMGGDTRRGMPVAYRVEQHDDWMDERHRHTNTYDGSALAFDLAVIAVLALCFSVVLDRALRSERCRASTVPSAVTKVLPHPTSEPPRARVPARRSAACLVITVVGSLVLGIVFGPLGWWWGGRLRYRYHRLDRRAAWTATTASIVGRAVVVTLVVCAVGAVVTR